MHSWPAQKLVKNCAKAFKVKFEASVGKMTKKCVLNTEQTRIHVKQVTDR